VFALNVAELSLRNCTLDHNKVAVVPALEEGADLGFVAGVNALGTGLGGGLWVGSNGATRAEVLGTLFIRNSGGSGGAVYVTGAAALTIRWSDFEHDHGTDWGSRGGGIVTDAAATLSVLDSYFYSCEANTGGAGWHGGQSTATYARCVFDENEGIEGEDMKGMALRVDDDAQLFVDESTFRGQFGPPLAEGTIALGGSNISHLTVTNSLFDNNVAHLGACLFIVRSRARASRLRTLLSFLFSFLSLASPLALPSRVRRRCTRRCAS
jgi:predicted outer membrane repeat protein